MVASRLSMESGVRLRPRLGRCDSSASRYAEMARLSVRPCAIAALWESVTVRFLRCAMAQLWRSIT